MTTALNAVPSLNPAEPSYTDDALLRAARRLASIHDGIKGQRIPPETMDFYHAIVRRDAYRPRMLEVVVPNIEEAMRSRVQDRTAVRKSVEGALIVSAAKVTGKWLENWLRADPAREKLVPCSPIFTESDLRTAYVSEGMQICDDALDYIEALAGR